jgi:arginase family enzyme
MSTTAVFFPFDLFGSRGAGAGAELLADAFRELLADNRREQVPTRARAYRGQVRARELPFQTLEDYRDWRRRARRAVRAAWARDELLFWVAGNHLGVLPVYDELARNPAGTLVVQFDAHLDVYNLTDCTEELSHGNFLLHCPRPLPDIVNLGHRELLLTPEHVAATYRATFPAAALAADPGPALAYLRGAARKARRVFLDLDCDVFDRAFFPATAQPVPFGLSPEAVLRLFDAVWSERVVGLAVSEFDPARDRDDHCLATLLWLLEYLLLKRYEAPERARPARSPHSPRPSSPSPREKP